MAKIDSKHMRPPSCRRIVWVAYAKLCTILIPDALLIHLSNGRLTTKVRRKAWREKVALFITYIVIGSLFCFWLEFITALFCDTSATYDYTEVYANNSKLSSINGKVVDWHELGNVSDMTQQVNMYPHYDLSPMFPRFMMLQRPPNQQNYNNRVINSCINGFNRSTEADNWLNYKLTHDPGYVFENNRLMSCPMPNQRNQTGMPCFYSLIADLEFDRYPKEGELRFSEPSVYLNFSTLPYFNQPGQAFVILDGKVLDITDYLDAATNIVKVAKDAYSRSFALERMFLPLDLTILFFLRMGEDITPYYREEVAQADQYKECLFTLFYHGVVNVDGVDVGCAHINLALWITMGCFLLYFLIRMNLANLSRLKFMQHFLFKSVPDSDTSPAKKQNNHLMIHRTLSTMSNHKYLPPYTLMFIPCFAESSETLRQTFDSLARASYPDTRKLLVFVCDGLVKSKTDAKDTYLCILDALGYSSTKDPELRSYISLGQGSRRVNYAKVYAGFYESGRNRVPFLMIVKVGAPNESLSATRAPGNRGKRDSMVIVLGFLERCMHLAHNRISPLEFELFNQCYNLLGIDPRELKYMLVTDADTQVQDDAVFRLVSRLEADPNILAINGHIRPANPEENIVTMLQIFPIYMTFYSGLAYEACLGSVTTINGGFVMYRLWTETSPGKNAFLYRHVIHSGGDEYSTESTTPFYNSNTEENIRLKRLPQPNNLQLSSKWPKVSDEIVLDDNKTGTHIAQDEDEDDDNSSSDDNITTTTTNTTVTASFRDKISYRRRLHKKKKPENTTSSSQQPTALSLAPNTGIEPCCIQPTVLRGFAAPRPDTMHMENVLLQGEEQLIGLVLLRSHPQHRIAFEPEAIAYATIPTNFFALQALQVRNLRSTFHNQIEFQHVAKHLGLMYWILSVTKLMDVILSMPINLYLYSVFIRYFQYQDLAYAIIAGAFTCLILLHMFYFMIRRQFKYVLWFIIYGLFSVPIFNVYFPILACWTSDYANRWYDVWPTKPGGYHSRLHGIVMDEKVDDDNAQQEELEAEDAVVRMRLTDFEILEAEKTAQREKEQAEMLDAKFNGFTSFVGAAAAAISAGPGHASKLSWSSSRMDSPTSLISSPPLAQVRDAGYASVKMKNGHSRFASEDDARFMLLTPSNNRSPTPRASSINSVSSNSPRNPFASVLDDPFDDAYGELHHLPQHVHSKYAPSHSSVAMIHHKPSRSQSSYFSRSSFNAAGSEYPYYPQDMFVPSTTDIDSTIVNSSASPSHHRMRSYSTSSAIRHPYRPEDLDDAAMLRDSDSVISMNPSLSNSVISLERDAPTAVEDFYTTSNMDQRYSPHHILSGNRHNRPSQYHQLDDELSEGRNAPVHSRIATNNNHPLYK